MTKQEFLNTLRISLNGKISAAAVEDNISYYEDYINTQVRLGQSEREVLEKLGNPRLIARSVIEASSQETHESYGTQYDSQQNETESGRKRRFRMPVWLWIFLIVFLIFLIVGAVFSIVWVLLPILIPVGIVLFIANLLRRNR